MKKPKLDKKAFSLWFKEATKIAKDDFLINIKPDKKTFISYFQNELTVQQSIEHFINN